MENITKNIRLLAAQLKIAAFVDVVRKTWETSNKNPSKFMIVITPLLKRFTKDGLNSFEEKEKKDGLLKGTDNKLQLIKNIKNEYAVIPKSSGA